MTRRFDLWNSLGWLMLAFVILLAAAGYVALLVHQPVPTGFATSYALVALGVWWLTGRNLRAELEAVRAVKADDDAASVNRALTEVGSVGDKAFAQQALVAALLASWGEHEPDADTTKAAGGMATELLWNLEGQGCRVVVPGREPMVADPEPPEWMADSGYRPPRRDVYSFLPEPPRITSLQQWADRVHEPKVSD